MYQRSRREKMVSPAILLSWSSPSRAHAHAALLSFSRPGFTSLLFVHAPPLPPLPVISLFAPASPPLSRSLSASTCPFRNPPASALFLCCRAYSCVVHKLFLLLLTHLRPAHAHRSAATFSPVPLCCFSLLFLVLLLLLLSSLLITCLLLIHSSYSS